MKPQNLHTHTTFCDGKSTAEEMAAAALAAGCGSIGFSGHAPLPFPNVWSMKEESVAPYRAAVLALREEYAGRMAVYLGLEQDILSPAPADPYDYRIGSVHCLETAEGIVSVDHTPDDFAWGIRCCYGGDPRALVEDYYRQEAQVAEKTGCEIVGHFDLVTKFNEGGRFFDEEDRRCRAAALEALDALLERNVLFEINTGAMSRGYRSVPYPAPFLLRHIHARRGRILVTGDSHSAAAILHGYPQAFALAAACGFTASWYFDGRQFVDAPLPR